MSRAGAFGAFVFLGSIVFAIFYVVWFFGLIPALSAELAVRIPVLVFVLALCFIAAWLGWVMVTSKPHPLPGPAAGEAEQTATMLSQWGPFPPYD